MVAASGRSAVFALALLVTSLPVFTCNSPPLKGTPDEQLQQVFDAADAVFIAKIRKMSRRKVSAPYETVIEDAQLVVTKVFKGVLLVGQPVMVRNHVLGACDLNLINDPVWAEGIAYAGDESRALELSDTWLIFALGQEPWALRSDGRSISVNHAPQELEFLQRITGGAPHRK
jgi:hypothetical protein